MPRGYFTRQLWITEEDIAARVVKHMPYLAKGDALAAIGVVVEHMSARLAKGGEIFLRGFGIFVGYRGRRSAHVKFFTSRLLERPLGIGTRDIRGEYSKRLLNNSGE